MDLNCPLDRTGLPTERLLALSGDDCQQDRRAMESCQEGELARGRGAQAAGAAYQSTARKWQTLPPSTNRCQNMWW